MSDEIPAKAEMLASDIDLVISDPRWAAARLVYLESEIESLTSENTRLRALLEEKWISVEERLPQEGDDSMGFVVEWRDGEDPGPYIALWDSISGAHWMPLPPLPGDEQ